VLLTLPLFNPNFGGVPNAPDRQCWASKSTWTDLKLFGREIMVELHIRRPLQT